MKWRRSLIVVLALVSALSGARLSEAQIATGSCSIVGQNQTVRDILFDVYFWNTELPRISPVFFPSPEAYLEAVRYRPLDTRYSFITDRAAYEALQAESQYIGLGYTEWFDGTELRLSQVYPSSPASEGGLARGNRIIRINGRSVTDLAASGELVSVMGPRQEGVSVSLTWRTNDGAERSASFVKRVVTIPTVSAVRLYEVDGRKVGYLNFRNFTQPSYAGLDAAFTQLKDAGATELVLDLRYNGGGLVDVAQHLASLVGGSRTLGQLFAEFQHNDRNRSFNRQLHFEDKPNALNLSRLVVITTRSSASASELVINALRPFIPVVTVGDTSYGKPVGQYQFPVCDRMVLPVSFILKNALGQSDFFDGFPADCPAADDLDHELGDPREASLAESFTYLRTGACTPAPPAESARSRRVPSRVRPIVPTDGWEHLLGAR